MSIITTNSVLALFCVLAAAHLISFGRSNPLAGDEELSPAEDGSFYLSPNECAENEQPHPGTLPACEPTCKNPHPVCIKIFYSGLDFVPCFCKAPLVRNELTKDCVRLEDCPASSADQKRHHKQHHHKAN